MDNWADDWGIIEDNSLEPDCDITGSCPVPAKKLFSARLPYLSRKSMSLANILPQKDTPIDEVAEVVSPGGHTTKRRPRSRLMSQELLESAHHLPSPQVPPHVCYLIPFVISPLICYQTHSSRIASPKLPLLRPFCSAQSIFRGFLHSRLLDIMLTAHWQQRSKSIAQTIHARCLCTCQPTREW